MIRKATLTIDSISGGWTDAQYEATKATYDSSIAIDPDFAVGSNVKTSGAICPVVYEKFSSTVVTGYPKWLITQLKNENLYAYMSDGVFASYSSTLGSETSIGTPTSGAGNGAVYYNNYIYLATPTDVSRYGPLNGSPSLTNTVWTGSTLGSLTALSNTTYPSLRGTPIPNHPMHLHVDNFVYFGDVAANGQGIINKIKTKKVTVEGDTNDGSAYNALDLPFGYYPTDIESYGTDVAILAIKTTSATVHQGKCMLFLWDGLASSYYRAVPMPDSLGTALLNHNGVLYIWTGNAVSGVRLSHYIGGDSVKEDCYLEDGTPPFAGAVESLGNRINWGAWTSYPVSSASVFSYGSKKENLGTVLHNTIKSTSAGAHGSVTALKAAQQTSSIQPRLIVGWGDDSAKGIDKLSTTGTYASVWRSNIFKIGRQFDIRRLRIPLGAAIAANMSIVPKIYFDDESSSKTLATINSTNYDGRYAVYKMPELKDARGDNNFLIEFTFGGTVFLPITYPIQVDIEVHGDEP